MAKTHRVSTGPGRFVLEGVPKVHFFEGGVRCPEDLCFPSVLRALFEYQGETLGCMFTNVPSITCDCTYSYFVGASGCGSFLTWKPGWDDDNHDISYMSNDPEAPYAHAFSAINYGYELLNKEAGRDNAALFRERIVASLSERQMPVIAFGVIGPPEACLITGYDEEGEALIGWNFFQGFPDFAVGVEFEPSGYFRKRNWFDEMTKVIIVGDKLGKPDMLKVVREGLGWAVQVTRTPEVTAYGAPRSNGLAAYDTWAEHLLRDDDFARADEGALQQMHTAHNNTVGTVAEARWYGSRWLARLSGHDVFPGGANAAAEMLAAAGCYAGEHEDMWAVWGAVGGISNAEAWKEFAKPEVRRQIVPIIQRSRDRDAQAADYLDTALKKLS